ncbi:alpha/beta fold hydrolase [Streptomyces purpureus]|uniref:Alpha/beta hydrolase n=1 Tax=Streptomyces purpureus TaxID=1951 RepID=A0A918H153_9ACTN|nr:alpha/beta hydrolase [Streptomyces purpureus]GGT28084.1 alpha/beta hydrolase [Streptomyces purpureus]
MTTTPALLLAHGAGGGIAANFGPVLGALSTGRRVLGADYPGAGDTPRSDAPLELDDLADRLIAEADAAGLDRFALCGYSLGTAVAVRAAARHPGRVTALVLTAGFAYADHATRQTAILWRELHATGQYELLGRLMLPVCLSPGALNALSDEELTAAVRATGETTPPGSADHADLVVRADVREDLAGLEVPTLVIVTTEDRLVPPHLQRDLAARLPHARVAELATGHLPVVETPDAWAALITTFLDEVAA